MSVSFLLSWKCYRRTDCELVAVDEGAGAGCFGNRAWYSSFLRGRSVEIRRVLSGASGGLHSAFGGTDGGEGGGAVLGGIVAFFILGSVRVFFVVGGRGLSRGGSDPRTEALVAEVGAGGFPDGSHRSITTGGGRV